MTGTTRRLDSLPLMGFVKPLLLISDTLCVGVGILGSTSGILLTDSYTFTTQTKLALMETSRSLREAARAAAVIS
jgi:hypothetical protein